MPIDPAPLPQWAGAVGPGAAVLPASAVSAFGILLYSRPTGMSEDCSDRRTCPVGCCSHLQENVTNRLPRLDIN
ncbi:hypothetical protein J6590_003961 [Homalodisca vitripennis]|nr:hypothetical protein J6590_003961 [Homalodisca vitripennis]